MKKNDLDQKSQHKEVTDIPESFTCSDRNKGSTLSLNFTISINTPEKLKDFILENTGLVSYLKIYII